MTPRDLRNIHTIRNSCRDALPCMNMALKLPWYCYLLMEKCLDRYFKVHSPYYQAAQCNQKTPIPENTYSQKRISIKLITATTSIHLPTPVSTYLTIKSDSVLTNQTGTDGARLVDVVKHLPHKLFLS